MKRKKVIMIIIACIVVAGIVTVGILYTRGLFGNSEGESSVVCSVENLSTGSIEKSVSGTGTLSAGKTISEVAPVDMKIDTVLVKAGQTIQAGETIATLNTDFLANMTDDIQTEITSIDLKLAQQLSSEASAAKLMSQVSGRVKRIYANTGSNVDSVVGESGGLFVISVDGRLRTEIISETDEPLTAGMTVKVVTGNSTYTGLLEEVSSDGKLCTVTLTDNGPKADADAKVYTSSGTFIGSGALEINLPYYVTAASGSISEVYVSLNEKVTTRTALAYIVGKEKSETYEKLEASRSEYVKTLELVTDLRNSGVITASRGGAVQSVMMIDGQDVKQDGSLIALLMTDTFSIDVSVDELDINYVSAGQTASVNVDAVSDKVFQGTVESVSQIGTTNNGVTNFTAVIRMDADATLRIGMNATVTIVTEKHENVLLLPLEALQSIHGKQYVWLYNGTLPKDGEQNPGIFTEVQTGLSNDNFVEIVNGLSINDRVVIVRTLSSRSTNGQQNGMGFMGMTGENQRFANESNQPGNGQFGPPAGR